MVLTFRKYIIRRVFLITVILNDFLGFCKLVLGLRSRLNQLLQSLVGRLDRLIVTFLDRCHAALRLLTLWVAATVAMMVSQHRRGNKVITSRFNQPRPVPLLRHFRGGLWCLNLGDGRQLNPGPVLLLDELGVRRFF